MVYGSSKERNWQNLSGLIQDQLYFLMIFLLSLISTIIPVTCIVLNIEMEMIFTYGRHVVSLKEERLTHDIRLSWELFIRQVKWGSSDPKGLLWYSAMQADNKIGLYEARWSRLKLTLRLSKKQKETGKLSQRWLGKHRPGGYKWLMVRMLREATDKFLESTALKNRLIEK